MVAFFHGLPSGTILHLQLVVSWQNIIVMVIRKKLLVSIFVRHLVLQYINDKKQSHFLIEI